MKKTAFVFGLLCVSMMACASADVEEEAIDDSEQAVNNVPYGCSKSELGTVKRFIDGCCTNNGMRSGKYKCEKFAGKRLWFYQGGNVCSVISCNQK